MLTHEKLHTIDQVIELELLPFTHHNTIRRMIRTGALTAINIGTPKRFIWRISQSSIDAWWTNKLTNGQT